MSPPKNGVRFCVRIETRVTNSDLIEKKLKFYWTLNLFSKN